MRMRRETCAFGLARHRRSDREMWSVLMGEDRVAVESCHRDLHLTLVPQVPLARKLTHKDHVAYVRPRPGVVETLAADLVLESDVDDESRCLRSMWRLVAVVFHDGRIPVRLTVVARLPRPKQPKPVDEPAEEIEACHGWTATRRPDTRIIGALRAGRRGGRAARSLGVDAKRSIQCKG